MVAGIDKKIDKVHLVQMRATKLLAHTINVRCEERLKMLNLQTLQYRRLRYDRIVTSRLTQGWKKMMMFKFKSDLKKLQQRN